MRAGEERERDKRVSQVKNESNSDRGKQNGRIEVCV